MKIYIKAKPSAKEESIEKINSTHFMVSVKEPPVQGKANEAIKKALAEYFKVAVGRVIIISGHTSRNKIVEIK